MPSLRQERSSICTPLQWRNPRGRRPAKRASTFWLPAWWRKHLSVRTIIIPDHSKRINYDALPGVIEKLETYDPSLVRCAVPCYFTCKLAADYVTVVLTGEGADEVFAGYHYMKRFAWDQINAEARRLISGVHNINLQRADRMGMLFSLELRVPFFDTDLIDLGMKNLTVAEDQGRKRAENREMDSAPRIFGNRVPSRRILWRYKLQYTQGAGCEELGNAWPKAKSLTTISNASNRKIPMPLSTARRPLTTINFSGNTILRIPC